jgi:hypothetical protein
MKQVAEAQLLTLFFGKVVANYNRLVQLRTLSIAYNGKTLAKAGISCTAVHLTN